MIKQLRVVAALCALSGITSATVAFSMRHPCSDRCGTMLWGTGGLALLLIAMFLLLIGAGLAIRSVWLAFR